MQENRDYHLHRQRHESARAAEAERMRLRAEGYFQKTCQQLADQRGWEVVLDEAGQPIASPVEPFLTPSERSSLFSKQITFSRQDARTGEVKHFSVPMIMKIVHKTFMYGDSPRPESHFQFEKELMARTNVEAKGLFTDFLAYFDEGEDQVMVTPRFPYELEGLIGGEWLRDWATVFSVCSTMMRGMEYLHKRGLIHGDFKPENCYVTKNGGVRLGDLETVRPESDQAAQAILSRLYTPAYADTKFFTEETVGTQQTDLVALAATIYRVVTNGYTFFYRPKDHLIHTEKPQMPNIRQIMISRFQVPPRYYPLADHFFPVVSPDPTAAGPSREVLNLFRRLDVALQRALAIIDYPFESTTEFRVEIEDILSSVYYSIEAQALFKPKVVDTPASPSPEVHTVAASSSQHGEIANQVSPAANEQSAPKEQPATKDQPAANGASTVEQPDPESEKHKIANNIRRAIIGLLKR